MLGTQTQGPLGPATPFGSKPPFGTTGRWLPALLVVVLGLSACRSANKGPDPTWSTAEVRAGSENFLWTVTKAALNSLRYPVGAGLDPSEMVVVTGWRTQLAPFRGQGVRHRAEIRYTPLELGQWQVQVRVQHQVNMDIVRPLDPTYAEWEWRPDSTEEARVLLGKLRSLLDEPLDVGPPPRTRRG